MKIAIVGSRGFPEPERVRAYVRSLKKDDIVISGGAKGVDSWAVEEAKVQGLETQVFPADWDLFGKSAGYRRNVDIVEAADFVVAFWDGKSKGTAHTIKLAQKAGKPVEVLLCGK